MNKKYIIRIDKTDEIPEGVLVVKSQSADKVDDVVLFSPINILGDLLSSVYSESLVDTVENFNICNNSDYHERLKRVYSGFDVAFGIENCDSIFLGLKQYYQVILSLLVFMTFQNSANLHDFDYFHAFFKLNYKWKAFLIDDIEMYKKNKWHTEDLKEFTPDEYTEFKYMSTEKSHICVFACDTKADVVFSILQYLLLSGYCFKQCSHCQKYFAVKPPYNNYCKRKSPIKNFESYECEEAVSMIKKDLQKKKRAVCSNIIGQKESQGTEDERKWRIDNIFDELKKQIKEKPNLENIRLCNEFLTNTEMKSHFYQKR